MKKSLKYSILFVFMVVAILTSILYYFNLKDQKLPVLSPSDVNPELVDPSVRKGGSHKIENFQLVDQHGKTVDQQLVKNKIYVADFFFTTCQSICPVMTGQMGRVAEEFKKDTTVKFLSFSVTPEMDQPEILNQYAIDHHVDYDQWRLMTGEKAEIYQLARKSYFTLKEAEVGQGDGGESDFIHTNNFVLIDTKGQIRGYYDGTSLREVDQLIEDIKKLKKNH